MTHLALQAPMNSSNGLPAPPVMDTGHLTATGRSRSPVPTSRRAPPELLPSGPNVFLLWGPEALQGSLSSAAGPRPTLVSPYSPSSCRTHVAFPEPTLDWDPTITQVLLLPQLHSLVLPSPAPEPAPRSEDSCPYRSNSLILRMTSPKERKRERLTSRNI